MKQLSSVNKLKSIYKISSKELEIVMHKCIRYYLSEEELYNFILELQMKKEDKINKKLQV